MPRRRRILTNSQTHKGGCELGDKRIKGITVEIDGKTTGFTKALKAANSEIKNTKNHLKDVEKALKIDPTSTEMLKAKQHALNEVIAETKKKLEMEEQAAKNAAKALASGDITQSEYDAVQAEIVRTTNELKNLEEQARETAEDISGHVQTIEERFEAAGNTVQEVGNKIQEAGRGIQEFGDKIGDVGGKMTAKVTLPVVAGGTAAVKMATDYGSSLAKLSTIADTSQVPIDELDEAIKDLSNQTGISASEVAEASYQAISAGQSTEDAVKFVEEANVLATAGFTDLTTATDTLTTALNAYGLSSDEVSKVSDKLITTQNLGKTTVDEMGASLGKVIPTAAMYGVNLDQISAAYITTTKNGISTAESTTYLNGMLNELGKSGSKTSEVLKQQTGKSFKELMDEGYSLSDVLDIIQTEADKSGKSLADMFGSQEAAKAAATITQHTEDFTGAIKELENSAGVAQDAFELLEETDPSIQFEKTKIAIQNAAITIGQIVLPVVQQISSKIQDLVSKFQALDPETKEQIVKAAAIAAAIGPVLIIIGKVVTIIGALVTGIGKITTGIGGLISHIGTIVTFIKGSLIPAIASGISAALPVIAVIAGIVAAIIAVMAIIKNWETIVAAFKEFFTTAFQAIGDFFKTTWDNIVNVALGAWQGIQNVFSAVGAWFTNIFQQAWNGITGIFNRLAGFFQGVWNSVTSIFKSIGVAIADAITGAVRTAVNNVLSGAIGIINGFIGAINAVIGVINAIPGVNLSKLNKLNVPQLEKGGILRKGEVGLLEGNGAEAVVPLDRNEKWVAAVAKEFQKALAGNMTASAAMAGDIVIPVYIGQSKINDIVVKASQSKNYRSGGR